MSDGSYTDDMDGLFTPAHAEGSAVLRFARPGMRSDPACDLTLAVFAVDDDQVHWARQIPLGSSD